MAGAAEKRPSLFLGGCSLKTEFYNDSISSLMESCCSPPFFFTYDLKFRRGTPVGGADTLVDVE